MKFNKFLTILSVITLSIFVASCVEDDDFSTPDAEAVTVDPVALGLGNSTTFSAVVSRYLDAQADGDPVGVFSVENDEPLYIVGYVISSDKGGNFFEELVIQNTPGADNIDATNPRLGLNIQINVRSLSDTFDFGRKVFIRLNGLAIGLENGVYTLGKANGNSLEQLQESEYLNFVYRDAEIATVTPKTVASISDFTEADENTFIQLNNMQVNRNDLGLTLAGEADDQFDGFRTLESCDDNLQLTLQTSTFADFKLLPVPQYSGTINGILTRDFGDDFNVLVINSIADINFDNTERCDPIELSCGEASTQGSENIFEDDFEGQSTNSLISGNGWTNYIQEGSEGWEAYTATGSNASLGISARVGSFNSGDASSIAWLITPAINLDAQDNETLVFQTSNSFSDGSNMEVLFSSDWDGTEEGIVTASWGIISDAYVVQDSDSFSSWFDSGIVDLSCADGTIYIAFKYTGSGDSGFDGTYELDGISIDY